jgi:hypothetical protein
MNERDTTLQKLEAEQRESLARFRELEAQADLAETEDELDILTGARERRDDIDRELKALRAADQKDWERLKTRAHEARLRFGEYMDRAGLQWAQLRETWRRQREAELLELGAQVDRWDASRQRTAAEDSLLTREEFDFIQRELRTSGELLKGMRHSHGRAWSQARERYEASWRDLMERSQRIRTDGGLHAGGVSPS